MPRHESAQSPDPDRLLHRLATILTLRCGGGWKKTFNYDSPALVRPGRPGAVVSPRTIIFLYTSDDGLPPYWAILCQGTRYPPGFSGKGATAVVDTEGRGGPHATAALVEATENRWQQQIRSSLIDNGVPQHAIDRTLEEHRERVEYLQQPRAIRNQSPDNPSTVGQLSIF